MHKLLTLLFSCLFLQSSISQAYDASFYDAFPGLDEIVSAYYSANPDMLDTYLEIIKFEKHKDGWYVTFAKREDYENPYKKEKLWDSEKKLYLIEEKNLGEPDKDKIKQQFRAASSLNAFLWPVYGYAGASKDVIELLGKTNLKKLKPAELEGLARAYEDQANYNYLGNYGHSFNKEASHLYDSTFSVKFLDPKLMKEAEENAWKAVDCYKKMAEWYPDYQTILGSVKMKYADNPVAHYLNFEMFQQMETADKFMDAAVFTEDMTEMAKNYLRSCPPNAILLTYGDNDTYPLLYVQQKLNFRKDVTVINRSLMAVGRCIFYYTELLPEGQRIEASLGMEHYRLNINDYQPIVSVKDNDEFIPMAKVLNYIDELASDPDYYKTHENRINFPVAKIILADSLQIDLGKVRYLTKDILFLFDIIESNYRNRPICFTNARFDGALEAFEPYLEQQGLVLVLTRTSIAKKGYFNRLNLNIVEDKLLNEFVYPKTEIAAEEFRPTLFTIFILHSELINHYLEQGDTARAKKILTHLHKVMPIDQFAYGNTHVMLSRYCLDVGDRASAQRHLEACATELEADLKEVRLPLQEKTALQRHYIRDNERTVRSSIDALVSEAEAHGFEVVAEEIRKRFK